MWRLRALRAIHARTCLAPDVYPSLSLELLIVLALLTEMVSTSASILLRSLRPLRGSEVK